MLEGVEKGQLVELQKLVDDDGGKSEEEERTSCRQFPFGNFVDHVEPKLEANCIGHRMYFIFRIPPRSGG